MIMNKIDLSQLKIDNEFRRLFFNKSNEKIKKLKASILSNGCINPLPVWNDILLDGYDRYDICIKNDIPFEICEMNFKNRNEAIEWICENQLKRKDLTLKMKAYLIGKLFEVQKSLGIEKGISGSKIINKIAAEYNKHTSTIWKYSMLSRTIDELADNCTDYINDILTEKISVPYDKMFKQLSETHKYCRKSPKYKIEDKTSPAQIKIMPDYDPDADLAGLKLTIPSWIGSIERVKNSGNFEKATSNMKIQLISALKELDNTVKNILKLMEENKNE